MHFFENQSYYLIQAVFYMINQFLSSELNLVEDFHDAKHFSEVEFLTFVYYCSVGGGSARFNDYFLFYLSFCS